MMTRPLQAFLVFLALASFTLSADDFCWVNKTFRWNGTGTVCTEVFPLFGDDFRINYAAARNGALKITLVDAATKKPKPSKVVVSSKQLQGADRKSFSGLEKAYLVIEGDSRGWSVSVDQYLDSVQEWRLKTYQEERGAAQVRKLGVWAEQGSQQFQFTPQEKPWRITVHNQGEEEGTVRVTVRTVDQRLLFQSSVKTASNMATGWIHTTAPVTITLECGADVPWLVEADTF